MFSTCIHVGREMARAYELMESVLEDDSYGKGTPV